MKEKAMENTKYLLQLNYNQKLFKMRKRPEQTFLQRHTMADKPEERFIIIVTRNTHWVQLYTHQAGYNLKKQYHIGCGHTQPCNPITHHLIKYTEHVDEVSLP